MYTKARLWEQSRVSLQLYISREKQKTLPESKIKFASMKTELKIRPQVYFGSSQAEELHLVILHKKMGAIFD